MEKQQHGLPAGRQGFTLIEILIVVAIIVLLSLFVFINLRGQAAHATDIKRKTDLYTLRKSFEDYNNDHGAFPAQSVVNNCGSADIAPYLARIPCDPATKLPYGYFPAINGGYRICAKLSDTTDPAIAAMGCTGPLGCGLGGGFNYCLTSGVTASAVGTGDEISGGGGGGGTPSPTGGGGGGGGTPVPTPTPSAPAWACAPADFLGISYCKSYTDPAGSGCPKTYPSWPCDSECLTHPEVRCIQ